jgi:hypothetical protein
VAGNYVKTKKQLSCNTLQLNVTIEHMALLLFIQALPGSNLCRILLGIPLSFLQSFQQMPLCEI